MLARDLDSYSRWPLARIGRVAALAAGAGLLAHLAWTGTTVAIVPAGASLFVAALDAIEPLAQELDHPDVGGIPIADGELLMRHLGGSTVAMVLASLVGVAAAWVADPHGAVLVGGLALVVPVSIGAVAGAAASVASEPLISPDDEELVPPELGGPRLLLKVVWPPAIVVLSLLPIRAASRAAAAGEAPFEALLGSMLLPGIVIVLVLGWLRFRRDIMASVQAAGTGGSTGANR
ncbi:MAG: hypothetical protein S0880_29855 [Actinomycetota bacterium]|nr:hypothetical protein [Actinomycetota bacterium]